MKYSLKNQYKHLIKEENEPDPVINSARDLIKIEFPGDPPSIARYYNVGDASQAIVKPRFLATRDKVLDLGLVSFIDSGLKNIVTSTESMTNSKLKSTSKGIETRVKNIFVRTIIEFFNRDVINNLINLKTNQDFNVKEKIENSSVDMYLKFLFRTMPFLEKIINKTTTGFSNPNKIPQVDEETANYISDTEDKSELEKIFLDILLNIENENDFTSSQIIYSLEDFIRFKFLTPNEDNINLCFRSFMREKKISSNTKVSVTFSDFFSSDKYIKEMFLSAKKALVNYIDFKIQSNESAYTENSFILENIKIDDILKAIVFEYCDNITTTTLISDLKKNNIQKNDLRKECSNIDEAISHLNIIGKNFLNYKGKGGQQGAAKGAGEFHVHMFLNTTNACLDIEPDAILSIKGQEIPCSIKAFNDFKSTAQTGTTLKENIKSAFDKFIKSFFNADSKEKGYPLRAKSITGQSVKDSEYRFEDDVFKKFSFISQDDKNNLTIDENARKDALQKYKKFKSLVGSEHDAAGVITFHPIVMPSGKNFNYISEDLCGDLLTFGSMPKNKRISFSVLPDNSKFKFRQRLDKLILMLLQDDSAYAGDTSGFNLKDKLEEINKSKTAANETKKLGNDILTEGGKAGHMMHPYENLHMKISDMKRMIEDFQSDFEISEKVDGANLFFTVNPQTGQVLFSRNKADMSYQETLDKFGPDHPAHVLFTEGANAIFNAVKNSLSRDSINQIFGKAPEGGKTYVNFEIMHPQKPNQIKYDMKYIVFHAIVDFDINGKSVNSSPDDERLIMLLDNLQPYFSTVDNDFNLGSNLKIKLNNLSREDIEELLGELDDITRRLGINEEMTIADAVKSEIKSLLDKENLTSLLSDDRIEMIYDFVTNEYTEVKGTAIKKGLEKDLQKSLANLGLTSKTKTYGIIKNIIKEFSPLFILLGIKLLHNIPSRYMSSDASTKNVVELKALLNAAISDYDNMINSEDLSDAESKIVKTLSPHIANVRHYGIDRVVSSPVEGGVFIGKDGNTYKVTGGFAPLNQILGTAMRSLDLMPTFRSEFISQERGS